MTPFSLNSDFTLASTTGGKDLGLSRWYRVNAGPALSLTVFSLVWAAVCFCFYYLTVLVWHTQFHVQSAMEANGPEAFDPLCVLTGTLGNFCDIKELLDLNLKVTK